MLLFICTFAQHLHHCDGVKVFKLRAENPELQLLYYKKESRQVSMLKR